MLRKDMFFTSKTDVTSIDIPTMLELSDDEYREYVRNCLLFVDHHDALRFDPAGCPLAITREQIDILVAELEALRLQIPARNEL